MACALTSDYSLSACKTGIGGLANVYFIEKGNITAYTKASGVITGITKATGKYFRKYELQRQTATFNDNVEGNPSNGTVAYKQDLTIILNRNDTATRNEILLLAKNLLVAVAEDKQGVFWMLGETSGLDLTKGKRSPGTQGTDRSGWELTFEGEEPEAAAEVQASIAAALQTPG